MHSGEGVPDSLTDVALAPVWEVVRRRLETVGPDNRGRVRVGTLPSSAMLVLRSLVGHSVSKSIDLAELENGLARVGVADGLVGALARLGHPVSNEREEARDRRRAAASARTQVRLDVAAWPYAWASEWADEVIRSGLMRGMAVDEAVRHVAQVRRVVDALDESDGVSRVELAAQVLGDSHALDRGTRLEASTARALRYAIATDSKAIWHLAGVHGDLVSGPALVWGLPVPPTGPLAALLAGARQLGTPVHLSQMMLRACAVSIAADTQVLVVENPRIVEAGAQRRTSRVVVATNGNPSAAVNLLLTQLQRCGAVLRCHADFDAAGLGICARLMRRGAIPWRMRATDYLDAVASASVDGVELPVDSADAPPTPWDPALQHVFDDRRRVVHEERLIDALLNAPLAD